MVYGAINQIGERYYTFLPKLFEVIDQAQCGYNWLVTDCECNVDNEISEQCHKQGYCWLSGEELTEIVLGKRIQWIWAVFSGFNREVSLEDVLREPLPNVSENNEIFQNPVTLRHPLAQLEITACDSSSTIFLCRDKNLIDRFRAGYPHSEDLAEYNARYKKG